MIRLKSETSEVAMNYDNLPDEMCALPNWACYRTYTNKEGKRKKVIINPQNGNFAKSNEPNTWTDFETAKNYCRRYRYSGLTFALTGGIVFIDIDHARQAKFFHPKQKNCWQCFRILFASVR